MSISALQMVSIGLLVMRHIERKLNKRVIIAIATQNTLNQSIIG